MVLRVGLAPGNCLLPQHVDGDAVFGVHHDHRAVVGGLLHGPEDLTVVGVEHPRVGHEQLEGGDPVVDHRRHLFERSLVDVADDHVEAVVDGTVPVRLCHPIVEAVPNRLTLDLHGEVDDRGGTTVGRGPGARLEVVRHVGAAEGKLEVGVDVDCAGDHQLAGGVDDPVGPLGPGLGAALGYRYDLLAVDEHVRLHGFGRSDDRSTFDDRGHGPSSGLANTQQ